MLMPKGASLVAPSGLHSSDSRLFLLYSKLGLTSSLNLSLFLSLSLKYLCNHLELSLSYHLNKNKDFFLSFLQGTPLSAGTWNCLRIGTYLGHSGDMGWLF